MTNIVASISDEDHAKLGDLLDKRRRLVSRGKKAKLAESRQKLTLAEKLVIERKHNAELADVNRQIDELMKTTGGSL